MIAIQDASIILVKLIVKFALNVILLCNFCRIINVLNPMNVKKVFKINYKINLVAIYKSLSGTINTCGDECPTNCNYFNILLKN